MKKRVLIISVVIANLLLAGCSNTETETVNVIETTTEETQEQSQEETQEQPKEQTQEEKIVVEGNKGVIIIGTTGTPYSELLTQAKIILAKEGWDLQIQMYSDVEQMNQDVIDGKIDAHLFAHQTYLESYNDVNSTSLTVQAPICYEKYGIYSMLNEDLTNVSQGVTIGIPQEDTKKAKALLFLEELGYLTLKEEVGLTAILEDIAENPKDIRFVEYTTETASEILAQADYCVMGADTAILSEMDPEKDVLKAETSQMSSVKMLAACLVTTEENQNNEKLLLIEEVLSSDVMKEYVEETYKGAVDVF